MGRESKVISPLFGTLVLVGLVWFCYAGISMISDAETVQMRARNQSQREELLLHSHSHINYVSKRRVPNGPDPIHNRRTVKSRQPPNRA